jgi:hypothetical protein
VISGTFFGLGGNAGFGPLQAVTGELDFAPSSSPPDALSFFGSWTSDDSDEAPEVRADERAVSACVRLLLLKLPTCSAEDAVFRTSISVTIAATDF